MANEVVAQNTGNKQFQTALAKTQNAYTDMVVSAAANLNLQFSDYQKLCVMNLLGKMQELLDKEGLAITQVDQTNITGILQTAAMLNLNASASPRECFVITRNVKKGEGWTKTFEFGVEGDGNDKILRTYGVNVNKVHRHWEVRENDEFTYPSFKGIEIVPPTWQPKDYTGKIIRIVYPIEMQDGSVQYHISEREEVRVNLLAHISNNLMKDKDIKDKDTLLNSLGSKSLDQLFEDTDALKIMSPAWRSAHAREAMILRKMRNNCIKKIPKDFQNAFAALAYEETFDDYDQHREQPRIDQTLVVDQEVETKAVSEPLNMKAVAPTQDAEVIEIVEPAPTSEPKQLDKPQQMAAPF